MKLARPKMTENRNSEFSVIVNVTFLRRELGYILELIKPLGRRDHVNTRYSNNTHKVLVFPHLYDVMKIAYQDLEIDGIVTLPMSRVEALLIKNVADLIIISEIKNHPGKVSIRYSRATKLKVKMLECLYADDIKTRSMLDQQNWVHIPNHIHDENHAYSLQVSLREALLIDIWLLPDSICNSVTLKGLLGQKTHINDNITRQIALLILCGGVEGGQIFSNKFTLNRLVDAARVGQKNHILPYRHTNSI